MDDLPTLFPSLLKTYQEVTSFSGSHSSDEFNAKIKRACSLCEKAVDLVNCLQLFSKNENVDDLSTTEIRYLIIPALYGYFLSQRNDERLQNIRTALTLYKEFGGLCSSYGICEPILKDSKLAPAAALPSNDAILTREAKIKRYKEKKALEEKMGSLASYVDQPHVDDEITREYHLTLVRHWALLVEDEYPTLVQEEQILSLSPQDLKEETQSAAPASKPFKPFILTRNAVQAAVFGAGYPSLPTMTVDQFADEQIRRGVFPAVDSVLPPLNPNETVRRYDPSDAERKADEKKTAEDDTLEDTDDPQYLQRARAMDEFKDEHRRGSGNRMNRA
ncbi:hypothetical protein CRM22_000813 [Opisthorchis felineus]|uniref:Immunoglobulin-binding protein 1 n=1 Tax=Opisthorchis felineus TaxID=147828 RepID=A0A4S2MDM3_OPIFE|nr:hypothetical protein CRM22_000813 [Opisthorchis felineus]